MPLLHLYTRPGHFLFRSSPKFLSTKIPSSFVIDKMRELAPRKREKFAQWKKDHGDKVLNKEITVKQALGMRGIKCLISETSLLDPYEGIRFRGYTIPDLLKLLPRYTAMKNLQPSQRALQPLPEGILYLLLTGKIPSDQEVNLVSKDLAARSSLSEETCKFIDSLPSGTHSMVQLSLTLAFLSPQSKFRKAYFDRTPKEVHWIYTLDDALDIIAKIPIIAARIFRNIYKKSKDSNSNSESYNSALDLSANFANLMGFPSFEFHELMRLYLTIHSDHEGGNVSTHTTRLVGSALSDPYLSYSSGVNGLAGPLHGLANQEVLEWLQQLAAVFDKKELTYESLSEEIWKTLKDGRVIPGYGHAVLKVTDPRYICQREFAKLHIESPDVMFKLVRMLYEVVPSILTELGKVSNPYPNVDAHSGVLLHHFGLTQSKFYTVLFAVSRSIGALSNLVIDRMYNMPLERPKSVTTKWIRHNIE